MPAQDSVRAPQSGVAGIPIEEVEHSGLRCFFSRSTDRAGFENSVRDSALQFHQVIHELFRQGTVIPFRFPTYMESDVELGTYLQQHEGKYRESLTRLRCMVQIEIRISFQASGERNLSQLKKSGSDYLRERQGRQRRLEDESEALRQASLQWTAGWRRRPSADKIRCFVLVERNAVQQFEHALAAIQIPADLLVRVTGPWPPTEFIDKE